MKNEYFALGNVMYKQMNFFFFFVCQEMAPSMYNDWNVLQ